MKFLYLIILAISFQFTQAQVIEVDSMTTKSSQELYDFHTLKQRKNKTTAWILFGSGILMTISGLIVNSADEVVEVYTLGLTDVEDVHKGDWLIYSGGAITLGSIPFFISAGKHKKKATLSLKREKSLVRNITFQKLNNLSVALTIEF